jgi:hypothetical protein
VEGVRPAEAGDIPDILELAAALRAELEPMRGGSLWSRREARSEPLERAYVELLGRDDARVVVGTLDDVIVGFATGEVERLADGQPLGVVADLFVGVGEAMLSDLVGFFTARGCVGVDALALPGHRAAKNFFEESGFTARAIVMHHVLVADLMAPGHPVTSGDTSGPPGSE